MNLADPVDISSRGAGLGLVGGIIFTLIVVATILLIRDMNRRVRRLPEDDEPQPSVHLPRPPLRGDDDPPAA